MIAHKPGEVDRFAPIRHDVRSMSAVETANYVQAAGTFAGVAPPPAPMDPSNLQSQQGFTSFIRNGPGDYTLGLQLAIGFLEAEVRVQPGVNQLVVIGGQVDPDTQRVQVRCYDTLGAPVDCQIFTIQVLKIATGPAGQLPLPPPPVPIVPGGGGALCLLDAPPGQIQAVVGRTVRAISGVHPDVLAPANPADCDRFGVYYASAGGGATLPVLISGNGNAIFSGAGPGGDQARIQGGTYVYQFFAATDEWFLVRSPLPQADTSGYFVAISQFSITAPGPVLTPLVSWPTLDDLTTHRWNIHVEVRDVVTGDLLQAHIDAAFKRDGASVVTQETAFFEHLFRQGSLAAAVVDFAIVAQTATLQLLAGVNPTQLTVWGQIHDFGA